MLSNTSLKEQIVQVYSKCGHNCMFCDFVPTHKIKAFKLLIPSQILIT